MAVNWSNDIVIVELADEPVLSEELEQIISRLDGQDSGNGSGGKSASKTKKAPAAAQTFPSVVLNFVNVSYVNSSNLAQLLKLRTLVAERGRALKLCCVDPEIVGVFKTTGLDKLFRFAPDPMTALAGIQIEGEGASS